jgi:pilus assembly protein CpaF
LDKDVSELRQKALERATQAKNKQGSITKIAYQQQQEVEQKRRELIPVHEKEYEEENRQKEIVKLREAIANYLTEEHSTALKGSMFDQTTRKSLLPIILSFIRREKRVITGFDSDENLAEYMLNEIAGLGPVDELIKKVSGISEIWVNGINPITGEVDLYYEKSGQKYKEAEVRFRDQAHAMEIAEKIARNGSQQFGTSIPLANVRYPDGRVNLVREPIATGGGGPYISFRLFPKDTFMPEDLLKYGSMNDEMYLLIKMALSYGLNTLIVGPTGSGKTTLMTASCAFIPDDLRILVMEDTEEMRLRHKFPNKHIITEECKFNTLDPHKNFDLSRLTINALRQKPDYMIYGEVRDKAAYDMLNGANTGHRVLSTLHSRSASKAVQRLINMVLEHGSKMSTDAIGKWISESIDLIIFQKLYADRKRRIKEIIELTGYENGEPIFTHLFRFVVEGKNEDGTFKGRHYRTGKISKEVAELMIDEGADINDVLIFRQQPECVPANEWTEAFGEGECSIAS